MPTSEFWGVYGFGMALGSPSCNVQGCVPVCWRISVVCLALELVGSWVELGFSVGNGGLNPKLENIRERLIPGNITR